MYKIVSSNGEVVYGINELVCDDIEDLELLPKCDMGSKCYVIGTNQMYIMNGKSQWILIGGSVVPAVSSSLGVAVIGEMNIGKE